VGSKEQDSVGRISGDMLKIRHILEKYLSAETYMQAGQLIQNVETEFASLLLQKIGENLTADTQISPVKPDFTDRELEQIRDNNGICIEHANSKMSMHTIQLSNITTKKIERYLDSLKPDRSRVNDLIRWQAKQENPSIIEYVFFSEDMSYRGKVDRYPSENATHYRRSIAGEWIILEGVV